MNTNSHKVIFRLSALGDVVLTTGVMEYWAEQYGFSFTVITRAGNVPVLENNPHISNVIGLEKNDLGDLAWIRKSGEIAAEYAGCELIDLHSTLRSAILGARWKGKVTRYSKFSLERRLFKLTRSQGLRKKLESLNVTQRYAAALKREPVAAERLRPRIHLTDAETTFARDLKKKLGLDGKFVALHPYATHPDKAWPRENWTELINLLDKKGICRIIIGRDNNVFTDHGNDRNLTNKLKLRETCAILREAELLVTGDSGPMHLAAAVGTPVTALFGPTSKAWGFYPSGKRDVILESEMDCRPCSLHGKNHCTKDRKCLRDLSPDMVMAGIMSQLNV
ncbi:glycosyltransferase family 9 protein [Maridesulfovibrio sp.]|uniref:glycosyltransferase family 9 protein n=1 Tax=Maridesulfovibrio sp. TaxID=2795000 RepID=UPI002A189E8F|nr:glycosyltransferase family 9 protein [Maridesulfovibrio sp.]